MGAISQIASVEAANDFAVPQREAAFFYGLFLRGHSAEQLRRDIEVPPGRPRKVAPRSGTRAGPPRHLRPHGGVPPPRSGPLRFARGFRRSEPPSAVASPTFLACTNGQAKKRLGNLFRLP